MRGGAPRSSLAGGFSDLAQPRRGVLSGGKRGVGVDVLASLELAHAELGLL